MTSEDSPESEDATESEEQSESLLICDTNIIVKMYVFKASVMFDATYSFGEVRIHPVVVEELQQWLLPGRAKLKKFGAPMIKDFIKHARRKLGELKAPVPSTLPAKHRTLQCPLHSRS